MGYDDQCPSALAKLFESVENRFLGGFIECARCLVENEDRRPLIDGASDSEPLALATGQADAAFPNQGFISIGE
jgi:hypothetical protein